jgi:hypothetical protein
VLPSGGLVTGLQTVIARQDSDPDRADRRYTPAMRHTRLPIALFALAASMASAAEQLFAVSPPATIVDLDFGKLKGIPSALAFSPTDGEFYLQTVDDQSKLRHYIIRLGSAPEPTDTEPEWALTYWNWKSTRYVPGHHEVVIQVDTRHELNQIPSQSLREKATGMENAATAGRGAAEVGIGAKMVRTLLLNGEVIGEYVDKPLVPGMTFGWSPQGLQAVAFVGRNGHLTLMDVVSSAKQDIPATSDVLLPAWSEDGSKIVFLQKTGRKTFALMRVTVSRP